MARILVVDDVSANRDLLATILMWRGHEVMEAADGESALTRVRAERPELIITDLVMPGMDGYEFVRRLRSEPRVGATPVIFCSATYRQTDAIALAQSCGRCEFLLKSASPESFLISVDRLLSENRSAPGLPADFDALHIQLLTDALSRTVEQLQEVTAELIETRQMAQTATRIKNELAALVAINFSQLDSDSSRVCAAEFMPYIIRSLNGTLASGVSAAQSANQAALRASNERLAVELTHAQETQEMESIRRQASTMTLNPP